MDPLGAIDVLFEISEGNMIFSTNTSALQIPGGYESLIAKLRLILLTWVSK